MNQIRDERELKKKSTVSITEIFIVFFKIGAFTFGGGYVMIPIIQRVLVSEKRWITSDDFYDFLIMIQGIPGPVALNCSIMVGKKLRGIKGGAAAIAGIALPSLIVIIAIAAYLYPFIQDNSYVSAAFYGIRPAVTALIIVAAYNMGKDLIRDSFGFFVLLILLAAGLFFGVHPIILILSGAVSGFFYYKNEKDIG